MKAFLAAALFACGLFIGQRASALAEGFAGTYQSGKGTCVLDDSHSTAKHSLEIVRTARAVQLKFKYADNSQPEVLTFVYGRSKAISGGGQLQNFITSPNSRSLRLVRTETDYRNHPVSVYSVLLTRTEKGLKLQSSARAAHENPMNCTYSADLEPF